ncbi:hypothetical protein L195_g004008 [Trifolium pratense]|uniref:Uncharacterized protein n=1 Tax=Trifolium pratense TaxID=57577 RepID=A0A2K3NWV3_TRIPR|nr:hypothetical protein L195_g004008 [Trifolium pratense]
MYLCFSGFAPRDADGDVAENATAYGVDRLRAAGIEVAVGVEEEWCKRLSEAGIYSTHVGVEEENIYDHKEKSLVNGSSFGLLF